jgi:CheY-like chemotaxis protein
MTTPPESLKILLVEDDESVRAVTAALARDLGHTVVDVGNAEEAMSVLLRNRIDMLIVDMGLPGMSGEVFAAQARGLQPSVRIIFATGSGAPGARDDGTTTVILRKPFDGAALAKALAESTHRR